MILYTGAYHKAFRFTCPRASFPIHYRMTVKYTMEIFWDCFPPTFTA